MIKKIGRKLRQYGVSRTLKWMVHRAIQETSEINFDRAYGTDTRLVKADELAFRPYDSKQNHAYDPVRVNTFQSALQALPISHQDFVFVDFGSGKGRALLLASHFPFKKIIGVELTPHMNRVALDNIRRYRSPLRRCFNVESICGEASTFQIPDEKSVIFFFNPFGKRVLRQVLSNIALSLVRCPRELFIIYAYPQQRELLDKVRFLNLVEEEKGYDAYSSYNIYSSRSGAVKRDLCGWYGS